MLSISSVEKAWTHSWRFRTICVLIMGSVAAILTFLYTSADASWILVSRKEIETKINLLGSANMPVYVISLKERQDRRRDMDKLRDALGLNWTYVDALPANDSLVGEIMGWVNAIRNMEHYAIPVIGSELSWPDEIEDLVWSSEELTLWNTIPWPLPFGFSIPAAYPPMACATKDYEISKNATTLPGHLILTPARVACWYSHLAVIHQYANGRDSDLPGNIFIFEDDIDMESDILSQLGNLWRSLPQDWDIVFLGHCWSDEARNPPLSPEILGDLVPATNLTLPSSSYSRLHASKGPKCTHAYALSRNGARRLLLHLRYPPFAFSRAIDQAIAWLVESGKLNSFSVVPSLVVQRKNTPSDVTADSGSKWKDRLTNGVLLP